MKKIMIYLLILFSLIISCNNGTKDLDFLIRNGEFSKAIKIIDQKLQSKASLSANEIKQLQKKLKDLQAVKREYTLSRDTVYGRLRVKIHNLSILDMDNWEQDQSLEYYLIDGNKKYYDHSIFDLFQVNKEAAERAGIPEDKGYDISGYPLETIAAFDHDSVHSKTINIGFTFFVEMGSLTDQTLLRAWIPYVRENKFQSEIRILRSSISNIILPKSDNLTSMIYFETVINKKNNSNSEWRKYFTKPSLPWIRPMNNHGLLNDSTYICQFIYEYKSKGYYKKVNPDDIKPYKSSDQNYRTFTKETENNLFTPYLKHLSKDIIGNETNDYIKARKIYEWICKNIVWTNPKPVLGDKAEYTAKYKRGDCGEKANLFISLCRINKIPARSQGGWVVEPNENHSQHTWAQVYFEPFGWIPVDADAGSYLILNQDEKVRYFYFGNRTPYRLIINDDDDAEALSNKIFDPVYGGGSQLGAFEWKGGDIEGTIKIDSHAEY
jgi:transglutaminase-like putative cysteine protease